MTSVGVTHARRAFKNHRLHLAAASGGIAGDQPGVFIEAPNQRGGREGEQGRVGEGESGIRPFALSPLLLFAHSAVDALDQRRSFRGRLGAQLIREHGPAFRVGLKRGGSIAVGEMYCDAAAVRQRLGVDRVEKPEQVATHLGVHRVGDLRSVQGQ
jgi:hypothetical protein